jgi:DNA-binding CsgD family transcriptional regulator
MRRLGDGTTSDNCPEALYRRYESRLRAWLAGRVSASPALVEDACASAWLILIAKPPDCGERVFGWLCTVALHEAYRLLRLERREPPSEPADRRPAFVPPGRDDPEAALEAKRALLALASLRERERRYMAWQAGGYRYREIQTLAGGATYTNVNRHLTRAHRRLRLLAEQTSERSEQGPHEKGADPVAIGSCRREGFNSQRRVRRGIVEPLCADCYRRAMEKVARELAEEAATDGRAHYRKLNVLPGGRPATKPPGSVAPMTRQLRPLAQVGADESASRQTPATRVQRTRCISEELLHEAKRLYGLGLSLRAVARTLLERTSYANAHSAEVALHYQFKRRSWPLRGRGARVAQGADVPRAA